jgi:hypothetical protein
VAKALAATCLANVVKIGQLPVEVAEVLSQGVASSSGIVILQDGEAFYIANISGDLKDVLTTLTSLLTNVVTVLTAHDGALGGTQAATIASITTAISTLTTKKENLK